VEVSDSGPGIPAADEARVFDRFYRSAEAPAGDGFGLGLAIARESARALGGDIELHDGPGGGTLALIVLPAVDRQAA
jgi:signal transduction histidine kinase